MPTFVDVLVEATGRVESVPAEWLDNPVLCVGLTPVEPDAPAPAVVTPPSPPSEVQTVLGESDDLPAVPAARDAVLAARAAAEAEQVPTEDNTHAEIDAFAEKAGIDLGESKTKAEKVSVIHQFTDGTEPSGETPANGEEE